MKFVDQSIDSLKINKFLPKTLGLLGGMGVLFIVLWLYLFESQENGLIHILEGVSLLRILPGWSLMLASSHQWNESTWLIAIIVSTGIYLLAILSYYVARRQSRISVGRPWLSRIHIESLYIIILILAIFPLLFLKSQFVFPDASDYLSSALDLFLGRGYSGYRGEFRGPIFPFLISITFHFFGANTETGLIVPKLVGVLNFFIIYLIGKSLFGRSVGFIGAILALSSDQLRLYIFSTHLLDGTLALLMNLFLLFIILAFEKENLIFFVLSGLSLGVGVLVKESGILWVTLPLIIFLLCKGYRSIKNFIGVWLATATFSLTLYPWMIYVYNVSHKIFLLKPTGDHSIPWMVFTLGFFSFLFVGVWIIWDWKWNKSRQLRQLSWINLNIDKYFPLLGLAVLTASIFGIGIFFAKGLFFPSRYPSLLTYLLEFFAPIFGGLFWFAGLAWGVTLLLAFRDRKHRFLAVAFLLILPLLIHLSYYRFEARNFLALIFLSYMLSGYYIDRIARYVGKLLEELVANQPLRDIAVRFSAVMGIIVLIAYPLPLITKQVEQNWLVSDQQRYAPSSYNVDNTIVHETASWIQSHIKEDTSLLFFYAWEGQLNFELKGKYPITTFRFDVLTDYVHGDNFVDELASNHEKYVYILREEDPTFMALFLYPESKLYEIIRDVKANYIVVGDRNGSLQGFQDFFKLHPAFIEVFKTEENGFGTAVYRIQPELIDKCPACPTVVQADAMLQLLDLVKSKKLDEFQFLQRLGEHVSIATRPGVTPPKQWAEAYAKLGEIYQEHGATELALIAYNRAVVIDPGLGTRYWPIINIYYSQLVKKYSVVGDVQSEIPLILQKELPDLTRDVLQGKGQLNKAAFTYRYGVDTQNPVQSSQVIYDFIEHLSTKNNDPTLREGIFTINNQVKEVLFQHPPSVYTNTVTLPNSPIELDCDIALSPEVWNSAKGDGVLFNITLLDNRGAYYSLFSKYIDPKNQLEDRKWHSCEKISLKRWAGRTVKIIFSTYPNYNNTYDWAGWGEPRIVFPGYYSFLSQFSFADYDDSMGNIHRDWMAIQEDFRDILYQHPPSQINYQKVLILENSSLYFGIGLDPRVWLPTQGDGVEFEILIKDSPYHMVQIFDRYIDPKNNSADRHWFDFQVDLSRFAGKMVDVYFVTHPGTYENSEYDWAVWSNPILMSRP
jgi:hypothetical protein